MRGIRHVLRNGWMEFQGKTNVGCGARTDNSSNYDCPKEG
ncbi:hypothetical protein FVEN_g12691 [Fusarium venenatum]|nr:hypothetical protein FVEN_g12691 [Fusarium venenatum]